MRAKKALKEKALAVATLIRKFNIREGMKPEDDRLPMFLHKPLQDTGKVITEAEMESMLKDYLPFARMGRLRNSEQLMRGE